MKKVLIAVVAAGLVASGTAFGERGDGRGKPDDKGGRPGGGPGMERGIGHLIRNPDAARAAGVTDEQIAAIKDAMYKHRKALIALESDLEGARLELQHLMGDAAADTAAVEKAIDEVAKKEAAISKARYRHRNEMKGIVGEETLRKLAESVRELRKDRDNDGPRGKMDRKGGRGEKGPGQCRMSGGPRMDGDDDAPPAE